jgi:hypothetical protein
MDPAVQEYRRRAEEVEKLAAEAISEEHRKIILRIAAQWRELADQREEQDRRWSGKLPDVMRSRAAAERQNYDLSPEFFADQYRAGIRSFFGVTLDWSLGAPEIGNDEGNPKFLEMWNAALFDKGSKSTLHSKSATRANQPTLRRQ